MANLTTTITESVVLNGSVRGSTNTITIEDITQVAEKIMEIPGGAEGGAATIIGTWAATVNTAATYQNYDYNDSEYVRVTNLDDTVILQVAWVSVDGESTDSCRFQLRPGETSMMWETENGKLGEATAPNFATALNNLSYISVWNPTTGGSVNVELFVAGKK
jgi:hypothetical protein